jgi:hypothetical protein
MKTQERQALKPRLAHGEPNGQSDAASTAAAESNATKNDVGRVGAAPKGDEKGFIWHIDDGARTNYQKLGQELAKANNNLFRNGAIGHGLIQVLQNGTWRLIIKAAQLAPMIVDSLSMRVMKRNKVVSELPATAHLNAMPRSDEFLKQFRPVDQVTNSVLYDEEFAIVPPGYHDGGDNRRFLFLGSSPPVADSLNTINSFLDVMDFSTPADRTNTVAAALTVLLRHHWAGQKPLILITATKSHAGKGTLTEFIRGSVAKATVLYESVDWPMQSQFQRQLSSDPEIGVLILDNVRLDSAGGRSQIIRSAWLESFVTEADLSLASPDAGDPVRLDNRFVCMINTNDGALSPDLLNRALTCHLAPKGDVHERKSPIGDPKLEFLPQNRDKIAAELHGMILRWRLAGSPLDETVQHPMRLWARTIGGILKVSGFAEFLANYQSCRATEDPTREALAVLAAVKPDIALTPMEWVKTVGEEGLAKRLFRSDQRETEKSRERAIGKLLSKYLGETFIAMTESVRFHVRLDGGQARWGEKRNPHTRYVFTVIRKEMLPIAE